MGQAAKRRAMRARLEHEAKAVRFRDVLGAYDRELGLTKVAAQELQRVAKRYRLWFRIVCATAILLGAYLVVMIRSLN